MRNKTRTAISLAMIGCLLLTGCGATSSDSIGSSAASTGNTGSTSVVSQWEAIPNDSADQTEENSGYAASDSGTDSGNQAESNGDDSFTGAAEDSSDVSSETTSEDADNASSEETLSEESPMTVSLSGIDGTMKGSGELISLMTDFMTQRGLNSSNYAVAYENLATGETFYYNELKMWDACSTYKFPLNLLYYDMEAAGQITEDTIIPGTNTPLSECHHQSLQYSNNELSEAMVNNLGAYDVMKQNMRKYFTLTDAEIDNSYYHHNYFCARMMMDCSAYLYNHQSEYPDALGYLEAAQPGEYFRTYITDCTIAQKYGLRDGYNHDAGIIFGRTPFVLSVYTYNAGGNELIGRTAELFYHYTEQ